MAATALPFNDIKWGGNWLPNRGPCPVPREADDTGTSSAAASPEAGSLGPQQQQQGGWMGSGGKEGFFRDKRRSFSGGDSKRRRERSLVRSPSVRLEDDVMESVYPTTLSPHKPAALGWRGTPRPVCRLKVKKLKQPSFKAGRLPNRSRGGRPVTWVGGGGLDLREIQGLGVPHLRDLFLKIFGHHTASNNGHWLRRKLTEPKDKEQGPGLSEQIRKRDAQAAIWNSNQKYNAPAKESYAKGNSSRGTPGYYTAGTANFHELPQQAYSSESSGQSKRHLGAGLRPRSARVDYEQGRHGSETVSSVSDVTTGPTLSRRASARGRPQRYGWQDREDGKEVEEEEEDNVAERESPVEHPEGASGKDPRGRRRMFCEEDLARGLEGAKVELFWPDDGSWWPAHILRVDPRVLEVQYESGETEELQTREVLRDSIMSLGWVTQRPISAGQLSTAGGPEDEALASPPSPIRVIVPGAQSQRGAFGEAGRGCFAETVTPSRGHLVSPPLMPGTARLQAYQRTLGLTPQGSLPGVLTSPLGPSAALGDPLEPMDVSMLSPDDITKGWGSDVCTSPEGYCYKPLQLNPDPPLLPSLTPFRQPAAKAAPGRNLLAALESRSQGVIRAPATLPPNPHPYPRSRNATLVPLNAIGQGAGPTRVRVTTQGELCFPQGSEPFLSSNPFPEAAPLPQENFSGGFPIGDFPPPAGIHPMRRNFGGAGGGCMATPGQRARETGSNLHFQAPVPALGFTFGSCQALGGLGAFSGGGQNLACDEDSAGLGGSFPLLSRAGGDAQGTFEAGYVNPQTLWPDCSTANFELSAAFPASLEEEL